MKILITASVIAQAYKLKHLLNKEATFIYADQIDMPAFIGKENLFLRIPEGNSASFAHELLTLCLDQQIDYVFPLRKNEILALAEARQLFEEYQIKVVVPAKPDLLNFQSSVPANGNILVIYKNENLLTGQLVETNLELETGVFVAVNGEERTDYYIYTAN